MLRYLHIKNFALIDSLQLSLQGGLNIISGETGAGKSILVGALNLLLGGRASADLIRSGQDEALVEAAFDLAESPEIENILRAWDIADDDGQIIVRRVLSRSGKNKIVINERLATMQMLAQLGGRLIDISGQYSQQLLLQTDNHLDILDYYGGVQELRDTYQQHWAAYSAKLRELADLKQREQHKEQRRELLVFQCDELDNAQLSAGEEGTLLQERTILANAAKLYERTYGVYASLYEADDSVLGTLKKIISILHDAAAIDPALRSQSEQVNSAVISLEDVAWSLRAYAEKLPTDSSRLEQVESWLNELLRLKKKYGKSVEELIIYRQEIEQELNDLTGAAQRIETLTQELAADARRLWTLAEELSAKREQAAVRLKKSIEEELATIGMKKTTFSTVFQKAPQPSAHDPASAVAGLDARGMDRAEFYISPNVGEEARPLSRIASGGELSRIVLAIKKILARNYRVATLLFDEVDAGIGGAVAEAVGEKLREIAQNHQVLCITHLPQIACFGTAHYSVRKSEQAGRTVTTVKLLDAEERVDEITRMLAGKEVTEKTRAHAQELLARAGKEGERRKDEGERRKDEG